MRRALLSCKFIVSGPVSTVGTPGSGGLSLAISRQFELCSHLAKLDTYNTADLKLPRAFSLKVEYADAPHRPASGDRAILVFRVGGKNASSFAYKFPLQLPETPTARFTSPS